MERALVAELAQQVGQRVRVAGWLHQVRALGGVTFVLVRDRSGIVQAVFDAAPAEPLRLHAESVIAVTGIVVAEPRAALGVELHDARIEVITPVTEILPFELNKKVLSPALDTLLDHAPVGLRHPTKQATFRLVAAMGQALRVAFIARGCTEIHTPKLVAGATEGGANLFPVQYFDRQAYLAQSPQLYKQIMVGVFERVFEIAPVFRAEPHATTRHLNEYVSVDVEIGFIEDHRTVMAFLRSSLAEAFASLEETNPADLALLGVAMPVIGEIPALHFRDALQLIYERHGEDARHEPDLAPQHERWLCEWAMEAHGSPFLFVTHYPTVKRPFYTMPDPAEPAYTHGFDLLFRGLEVTTGGQRIHQPEQLRASMVRFGVPPEPFGGYLEAFRFGMPPHGGFAIGLERLVMQLIGARNVRETTLFPRDIHRLVP
ncbi:MAG TPA: aspartate--tRNA(Asn) ligase [Thermomicrobiales bacterium]|jgi:nondiscriminating aspartyl-tRNA synthetase